MSTVDPAAASAGARTAISPNLPVPPEVPVPRGPVFRVAALGIIFGMLGVLFGGGVALFTNALVRALMTLREPTLLSAFIIALPALTIGLNLLLLFYGVRSAVAAL